MLHEFGMNFSLGPVADFCDTFVVFAAQKIHTTSIHENKKSIHPPYNNPCKDPCKDSCKDPCKNPRKNPCTKSMQESTHKYMTNSRQNPRKHHTRFTYWGVRVGWVWVAGNCEAGGVGAHCCPYDRKGVSNNISGLRKRYQ